MTQSRPIAADHYAIPTSHEQEPRTRPPRSKDPHLCITICGSGAASGRPQQALRAVDLYKIITVPSWC
jgi:hypothetical protein